VSAERGAILLLINDTATSKASGADSEVASYAAAKAATAAYS